MKVKVLAHTPVGKFEVGTIVLMAGIRTNLGRITEVHEHYSRINGKLCNNGNLTVSLSVARCHGFERTKFVSLDGRVI